MVFGRALLILLLLSPAAAHAQRTTVSGYAGYTPNVGLKNFPNHGALGHGWVVGGDVVSKIGSSWGGMVGMSFGSRTRTDEDPLVDFDQGQSGAKTLMLRAGPVLYPSKTRNVEIYFAPTYFRMEMIGNSLDGPVSSNVTQFGAAVGGNVIVPLQPTLALMLSGEALFVPWSKERFTHNNVFVGEIAPNPSLLPVLRVGLQYRLSGDATPTSKATISDDVAFVRDSVMPEVERTLQATVNAEFRHIGAGYGFTPVVTDLLVAVPPHIDVRISKKKAGWVAVATHRSYKSYSCVFWTGAVQPKDRPRTARENRIADEPDRIECDLRRYPTPN